MYWLEQYFLIDGKSTIVILYYFNEAPRLETKSYRDEAESNHISFVMLYYYSEEARAINICNY